MKIAAVVVTFNRKELLLETLRGLEAQSRPVDKIFLVNNASTDGTHELLQEKGFLAKENLEYIALETNTGGAGGFACGMQMAFDQGYDWVWTMDDDVEPRSDALEVLLGFTDISGCINSSKVFTENGETQYWEQYFDFATCRLIDLKNVSFRNGKSWCPTNVSCFEGMLVSRSVIEKIGVPDESYFIYHDDTVFGIKASFFTNVIYVRDAIFDKKIYGYGSANALRSYYTIRNSFKLKRQVFGTGFVGESSKFTNFLFFLGLLKTTFKYALESPGHSNLKALLKGWYHGFRDI